MRNAAARYVQEVNKRISCTGALKRPFLNHLEVEAVCFCEEHPDVDEAGLAERFGSPEEVAEEFLSEFGEQSANRCSNTRKRLLCLASGVILIALIFAVILGVRTEVLRKKLSNEDFVASITYETQSDSVFGFPLPKMIFSSAEAGS